MSSVTMLVTLGAAVARVLRILRRAKEVSMHAEVLAKMADSRRAVVGILLT